ncbi:MAG: hypothetical protein ACM3U2_19415 [Deltaproteobacteria bacterium]
MQSIPSAPQIQFAPTWLGLILILATGLAFLAFVAVTTVILSAGKPIVPWQRLKSLAAALALIVPALAVVVFIGYFWMATAVVRTERSPARVQLSGSRPAIAGNERSNSSMPSRHRVKATTVSAEVKQENEPAVASADYARPEPE